MDATEQIVHNFLLRQGHENIIFEPLGHSKSPDFSLNGEIGVEARRLNQHYFTSGVAQGLEIDSYRVINKIRSILIEYGPPINNKSWSFFVRFHRPVPNHKQIETLTKEALNKFITDGEVAFGRIFQTNNLAFDLDEIGSGRECKFVFGGYQDLQSGGFVIEELEKNIQLCVKEKAKKVDLNRHCYSQWWLALVDLTGFDGVCFHGICFHQHIFRSTALERYLWDRIIVISPNPPHQSYEVK
jgi:hypothetical protein